MEPMELPDTDSPDVMSQAIAAWLTHIIWQHMSRYHTDDMEEQLIELYGRVYKSVSDSHTG